MMKASEHRLIQPAHLPQSLWDRRRDTLVLPPALVAAYRKVLDRHSLKDLSRRDPRNPPEGGRSDEATAKHFAQAFDGSAARVQLAMLDPTKKLLGTSNHLVEALSGNKVLLTDAPCGAGAASLAILTVVAHLRATDVLPRQPLDVFVLGAEISPSAQILAKETMEAALPALQEQAIFVTTEYLRWDATDSLSTTDLVKRMTLLSQNYPRQLVVVANFNAALQKQNKRKAAEPQLEELFRHASGPRARALWIEPAMNRATARGGLFEWLSQKLQKTWRLFARDIHGRSELATSQARFSLPLQPGRRSRVNVAIKSLDLVRADDGA